MSFYPHPPSVSPPAIADQGDVLAQFLAREARLEETDGTARWVSLRLLTGCSV